LSSGHSLTDLFLPQWGVPAEWALTAQLVFGGEAEGARAGLPTKSEEPIEKRLFVHGNK